MWRQAAADKLCAARRAVGRFNAVLFWVCVVASDLSAALNTLDNLCATADKLRAVRRAVGRFNAVLFWVCVFVSDLRAALNTLDSFCATADKLRAVRRAAGCFNAVLNAVLFWVCVGCVLWAAVVIGAAVVFGVSRCGAIRMRSACVRACVRFSW